MNNALAAQINPIVSVNHGKLVTNSLNIAKVFGKDHHNVLKVIQNLEVPQEFINVNFNANEYIDAMHRRQPMYDMTRDAFSLVVMGFSGQQAMQFKLAYLQAFNLMEEELRSQANLAFLPDREIEERARRDGFDRAIRFFQQIQTLRAQIDMDEQTLEDLCFFRSRGLTQDEAARLCIISKREVERVEEILRAHGIPTTVVNMSIRKKQSKNHWTDLITLAGLATLPGKKQIALCPEVH